MLPYAKFNIGAGQDEFRFVQFTPNPADAISINYNGAKCYYRSGAWYVPHGGGTPRDSTEGPNWTIPAEPVRGAPQPAAGQAFKEDAGKPNWYLLMSAKGCANALSAVVRVLSFAVRAKDKGGKGYTAHSWREVPNGKERYEAALYRHLNKIHLGELVDDESGESHWAHIATNALFLAELHKADA